MDSVGFCLILNDSSEYKCMYDCVCVRMRVSFRLKLTATFVLDPQSVRVV
jgi:hypothetical protein